MKRMIFSMFAVAAAAAVLTGAGREEGGGRAAPSGRASSSGRSSGSGTVYRRQRVSVPRPSMPKPQNVIRDQSRPVYPEKNETGARISKPAAMTPPAHHSAVMRNAGFARNIGHLERTETQPNHYYWHNEGGLRYSHYFDGHNHWYGFYHGPTFYWTRYYGNRWWWFDAHVSRWVFWDNGYWWWAGPAGVPYVYVDNNYYPYDQQDADVTVEDAETPAPPASVPAADQGTTTVSRDGRRMVQVFGPDAQAFLYNKTVTPPIFIKYIGQGVSRARFSGGTGGAPLQLLIEFKDDTFALFDADGNSLSAAVQSVESNGATPPATPDSIPPPPSSAPGQ